MCNTKLEKKTAKIVSRMFYRKTFDITLLDRYFEEKDPDTSLVFSLHSYIYKNIGADVFIFSDVFDYAFRKIVAKFLLYYPTINIGSLKYTLDDSKEIPVVFSNESVQNLFNIWIKKER